MHKKKTETVEKLGNEALWVSLVWFDSTFSFAVCGFVALEFEQCTTAQLNPE